MEITFSDTTIFKFNRSARKWREKGHGSITFLLRGDDLMIVLGKQCFFVNDGIRPKGPNSFVVRVWRKGASTDSPDMILAIRFARERDPQRLAALLPDQILDQHQFKISKKPHKPRKQPPPWLSSLGRRNKHSMQSFIQNARIKDLKNGRVHGQLAKMYRLSPWQVEEAIDFFYNMHRMVRKRDIYSQLPSLSLENSESSLPGVSPHNNTRRISSNQYPGKVGYRAHPVNYSGKKLAVNNKPIRPPHSPSIQLFPVKNKVFYPGWDHESRGNPSEISAQLLASSGKNTPVHRHPEIGPNPNQQFHRQRVFNTLPKKTHIRFVENHTRQFMDTDKSPLTPGRPPSNLTRGTAKGDVGKFSKVTPRGDINKFQRVTPKGEQGKFSNENFRPPALLKHNYSPTQGYERSSLQGEPSADTAGAEHFVPVSRLTEQNLILLNKITPPLKGDYRTIVSTWLEKSDP